MPPMDARRRWLKRVPFVGWRSMPSIVDSPGDVSGDGKLDRASRKGGILWSSLLVPLAGLIDRMPTIMMGTRRPSLPPSSSCPCASPVCVPLSPCSEGLEDLSCLVAPPVENLNILKKFSGAAMPVGDSGPSSVSPPLCLNADAILPFCKACMKLSNVPSSPSPPTFLASATALWSSPIKDAAVAAAATDSSLDSIAA